MRVLLSVLIALLGVSTALSAATATSLNGPERAQKVGEGLEQVDALSKQNTHVRWLGIASGIWTTQDELVAYRDEHKLEMPLTLDETGTWFRSFKVMTVPTIVIVNRNGKIVRRTEGFDATLPEALGSTVGK